MKKTVLLAASIVLLAAGCGKASPTTSTAPSSSVQTNTAAQTTDTQPTQGQGTFKDLMAMGTSQQCDADFTSGQTSSHGTIYLASGKMRGDFSSQNQGNTIQSHMIVKDQTVYNWTEGAGMDMAFKTPVATSTASQGASQSQGANVDQQVNYSCQSWTEDDSMFDLPAGVTFSDQASMMQNMMPTPAPSKTPTKTAPSSQNECSVCNEVPAGAKAQCMAAYSCK